MERRRRDARAVDRLRDVALRECDVLLDGRRGCLGIFPDGTMIRGKRCCHGRFVDNPALSQRCQEQG